MFVEERFPQKPGRPAVSLSRHFLREALDDDDRQTKPETWHDVLSALAAADVGAVVIAAPPASGKSTELELRAQSLLSQGHTVILDTFAALAESRGLSSALFERWLAGDEPAFIFVDGADEALLRNPHGLRAGIGALFSSLGNERARAKFVITTRTGAVDAHELTSLLQRTICSAPPRTPSVVDGEPVLIPLNDPPRRVLHFALTPIDGNDISRLMMGWKVNRAAELEEELRARDFIGLIKWPAEAVIFVDYWEETLTLGTRSDMLGAFIDRGLSDRNRERAEAAKTSRSDRLAALKRIAAARLLCNREDLSLGAQTSKTISLQRLLPHLPLQRLKEITQSEFFDPTKNGVVRFRQADIAEYLAAWWFADVCDAGGSRTVQMHLRQRTRVGSRRVPPKYAEVAGWLTARNQDFFRAVVHSEPDVVLRGDPARLPLSCAEDLVKSLSRSTNPWLAQTGRSSLRPLANQAIGGAVRDLLREAKSTGLGRRLLLSLAELGRLRACEDALAAIALSRGERKRSRAAAVEGLIALDSNGARQALGRLSRRRGLPARLLRALLPAHPELIGRAILRAMSARRFSTLWYQLPEHVSQAPLRVIEQAIDSLVRSGVALDPKGVASRALAELFVRGANESVSRHSAVADLIVKWIVDRGIHEIYGDDRRFLVEHLLANIAFRNVFMEAIARRASTRPILIHYVEELGLAPSTPEDLLAFTRVWTEAAPAEKEDLGWRIRRWRSNLRDAERAGFDVVAANIDAARETLCVSVPIVEPLANEVAEEKRRRAKQRKRASAIREGNIKVLAPMRSEIAAGADYRALAWMAQHLTGTKHSAWARTNPTKLREVVGDDLADAAVSGLRLLWRSFAPTPRQTGDGSVPGETIAALCGLALDQEAGIAWESLSADDAATAVAFAVHEMNEFGPWLDSLLVAFPDVVRNVLRRYVKHEWSTNPVASQTISHATHASHGVRSVVAELISEEFLERPPASVEVLTESATILLRSRVRSEVQEAVMHYLPAEPSAVDDGTAVQLLRIITAFDPDRAAGWLRQLRGIDKARFDVVMLRLSAQFDSDLDRVRRSPAPAEGFELHTLLAQTLAPLLFDALRAEDDVNRRSGDGYIVTSRDRAQDLRSKVLELLSADPGAQAGDILASLPNHRSVRWARRVQRRHALDHAAKPWTPEEVVALEAGAERVPRSHDELHRLLLRRLAYIRGLVERDDFTFASLFRSKERRLPEIHLQRWLAQMLRVLSNDFYIVVREPEVQNAKRIDVAVECPGVLRVPIEIKPIGDGRYSLVDLRNTVTEQLIGRYMRPRAARCGVLLLGIVGDMNIYDPESRRRVSVSEATALLRAHARRVTGQEADIETVTVFAINFA